MLSDEFNYEEVKASPDFAIKYYKDSVYKGEVRERKRNGLGVIVYNNGRVYEGQWERDRRHGKGFEKYPSGNSYQGEF